MRDDDVLYRQFAAGAGTNLDQSLETAYDELKECRAESQSASNHALISFAILACAYFGIIESLESLGLKFSDGSILSFSLLASALLSFRSSYVFTRVSYLRAIFTAHLSRLNPEKKAEWIARHPLGYVALQFYSPIFMWPKYVIPLHKRIIFEVIQVILIGIGAIVCFIICIWIVIGAGIQILREGDGSFLSIATVISSGSLYVSMFFFPKYGSRRRIYRHTGLLGLLNLVEARSVVRKEHFLRKLARAQDNLRG